MKEPIVWICSDIHLGHKLMTAPTSPEHKILREVGYEEKFFEAANACVMPHDILCILGDVAFSNVSYWFTRIKQLNCRKVLLLGNHDKNRIKWYEKFDFLEIVPFGHSKIFRHELGNILLTHIPAFESVLTSYDERFLGLARKHNKEFEASSCILNIHGHCHGKATERHNTFDASLECINYMPVKIEQIIERVFK